MGSLSDFFTDDFKNEFAGRNLKVGSVFRRFDETTKPPKEKRCIVVGLTEDKIAIAIVYINTAINPFIANRPELNQLQFRLKKKSREILDYDSYVDCTRIYEFEYAKVHDHISEHPTELLVEVDTFELTSITELISRSRQIPKATLAKFGIA